LLIQAGVRPRLLVRDPSRLDGATRERSDVRRGDLSDAAYLRDATAGADALFLVAPEDLTQDDPAAPMVRLGADAAAAIDANGIPHTVFQSSVGAEKRHGAGIIDALARIEEHLDATGANVLHLRCGYFFTNLLTDSESLRAGVLGTAMAADAPMPWVDPRDIGDIVAARLLAANWTGREVQAVHGPEHLTYVQVADIVSAAIGRPVRLEVTSDDDVRAALRAAGLGETAVEGIVGMTSGLRDGFTPEQPRGIVTTTPTTLAAWSYEVLRPALK
jgi:uncharacterized protein YbjT (DUF2867 family)